jgi:CRISPR-associated protein Csm2
MPCPTAYFDDSDDKTFRPDLFDREAQAEARLWSSIKSSQLRRFFGQVMADRRRFELKGEKARNEEAQVAMAFLKASAAYTAAREPARKPLAEFIAHHAGLVRTIADHRAFARHFEAVVAWHKVFEKEREDEERQARAQAWQGGPPR